MALPIEPQTDEMFPETYVAPFERSDEVADLAADVIAAWDEFRGLRDALSSEARPLTIAYVFDTKPFDPAEADWTVHTVAKTTKASPLWQVLAAVDVVVAYRRRFWDSQEDDERRAFLHHALSHIDAIGSKVTLRDHPVEGFPWTYRRYGPLSISDRMFLRAGSLWTEDHPVEPTPLRAVDEAIADLARVTQGEGIESMTVSAGGKSVTLDAAASRRLDAKLAKSGRKPKAEPGETFLVPRVGDPLVVDGHKVRIKTIAPDGFIHAKAAFGDDVWDGPSIDLTWDDEAGVWRSAGV